MPRLAGIGLGVSIVLFAVVGFALDNWIQTVASALMVVSTVAIVLALRRPEPASSCLELVIPVRRSDCLYID